MRVFFIIIIIIIINILLPLLFLSTLLFPLVISVCMATSPSPASGNLITTVVEMHQLSPENLRTRRGLPRDPNNNNNDNQAPEIDSNATEHDDDDDIDGNESREVLKRLLSPQGALVADLASEIVDRLTSAERTQNLASMSRSRYVASQCVAIVLSLIGLAAVAVFAVVSANNTPLGDLLISALNQTLLRRTAGSDETGSDEEASG